MEMTLLLHALGRNSSLCEFHFEDDFWDPEEQEIVQKYLLRSRCGAKRGSPSNAGTKAHLVVGLTQKEAVVGETALFELLCHYSNDINQCGQMTT